MITNISEIRVAIVGNVCAGKTTVLNALFGDKFSETSMKRTTAGVNLFRISPPAPEDVGEDKDLAQPKAKKQKQVESFGMDWSVISDDQPSRSAASVHEEIRQDNRSLRSRDEVVEKSFTIQVEEQICDMKSDVQLVVVDIPGINEAGSSPKYKHYVEANWGTFDCVIVVMDAVQGVNTQEQVDLLKFVHRNNQDEKNIPTIILGNKVDDPEHEGKLELVDEAREKAVEIFGKTCSKANLKKLKNLIAAGKRASRDTASPVFIPVSAAYAFLYRKAGKMTIESLRTLDKEILDGIGEQEVVPKKWAKLSHSRKCQIVHASINNPSEYKESLERTNFETFLSIFRYFIGGETAQNELIANQVSYTLKSLTLDDQVSLSESIRSAYRKCQTIEHSTADLPSHFWRIYDLAEKEALKMMKEDIDPSSLAICFVELEKYHAFSGALTWTSQQEISFQRIEGLLREQLTLVIEEKLHWSFANFFHQVNTQKQIFCGGQNYCKHYGNTNGCNRSCSTNINGTTVNGRCGTYVFEGWKKPQKSDWKNISPQDWINMFSSLLLPATELEYYKDFGAEKTSIESTLHSLRVSYNPTPANGCGSLSRLENECLEDNEQRYLQAIRNKHLPKKDKDVLESVVMPSSIEDKSHWGHLGYKYVCFQRSLNSKK